jgi:Ran GTPase-activating protein (RanGAP) involved in mRNA processing and transport
MNKLEEALESIANGAEKIVFRWTQLDLESVRRLMAACSAESSKGKKLDLWSCGLDAEAAEVITSSLRINSVLTWLDLSYNMDIGPRGAQVLAEMLCVNVALKVLWFQGCYVRDEGAGCIAVAFHRNTTLEKIYLGDNGIAHVGATAIAAVLPFNQTLKFLDLCTNPLGDYGVAALAKAVPFSGLQELWLTETEFGEQGCAALFEMLKNGSRLQTLWTDSDHWPALDEGFRCNGWLLEGAPTQYLERNKAMHLLARKSVCTLLLFRKLRRTVLSTFPKEVVREIAQFLYSCRGEVSVWDLKVARQEQRTGCLCF